MSASLYNTLWCVRTVKKLSWDDEPSEGAAEARDREVGHCAVNWHADEKIKKAILSPFRAL